MQTPQMHFVLWRASLRCISSVLSAICCGCPACLVRLRELQRKELSVFIRLAQWHCVIVSQIHCSVWLLQWPVIVCRIEGKLQMMFGDLPQPGRVDKKTSHSQNPPALSWWYFPHIDWQICKLALNLLFIPQYCDVRLIHFEEAAWRHFFERWL